MAKRKRSSRSPQARYMTGSVVVNEPDVIEIAPDMKRLQRIADRPVLRHARRSFLSNRRQRSHTLRFAVRAICLLLTCGSVAFSGVAADKVDPASQVVDRSTLTGKVMCGYQGWFNCDGDGANLGWKHWARNSKHIVAPGNVTVDLWPDVSDLDSDECYSTSFTHSDGSAAQVFSSAHRKTVLRHFRWMQQYGIDGAFVQRFAKRAAKIRRCYDIGTECCRMRGKVRMHRAGHSP